MQNGMIAVQDSPQMMQAMQQLQAMGQGGMGIGGAGSDLFAALLGQLMMGMPGEGQDGEMSLFSMLAQNAKTQADKEGEILGMQMFAEMLSVASPQMLEWMASQQQADGSAMQQVLQELTDAGVDPSLLAQLYDKSAQADAQQAAKNPAEAFSIPVQEDAQAPQMRAVSAPAQEASAQSDADLLGGQNQFRDAVAQAQKLLDAQKQDEKKVDYSALDIDKMQRDVDNGRFKAPITTVYSSNTQMPDAKNVAQQVRTGILENIGKGKNEFVVKLRPEGLGEITVKMVETSGKIALSIMTSSSSVAKMINGEMAGLREALRPFNAEVHEVYSQQQGSQQQSTAGFEGQQNPFQQQSSPDQQRHPSQNAQSFDDFLYGGDEEPTVEEIELQRIMNGLDTYI